MDGGLKPGREEWCADTLERLLLVEARVAVSSGVCGVGTVGTGVTSVSGGVWVGTVGTIGTIPKTVGAHNGGGSVGGVTVTGHGNTVASVAVARGNDGNSQSHGDEAKEEEGGDLTGKRKTLRCETLKNKVELQLTADFILGWLGLGLVGC